MYMYMYVPVLSCVCFCVEILNNLTEVIGPSSEDVWKNCITAV